MVGLLVNRGNEKKGLVEKINSCVNEDDMVV